jgi:hypothetical protein
MFIPHVNLNVPDFLGLIVTTTGVFSGSVLDAIVENCELSPSPTRFSVVTNESQLRSYASTEVDSVRPGRPVAA